jgi:enoyl-CoA hydratase/carnithine racemase
MAADTVSTREQGPVLVISLDRPAVRNAIDRPTALRIEAEIDRFERDDRLQVAVITGSAGFFCAGADLKAARGDGAPKGERRGWFGLLEQLPGKPLISAVEGMALGGGFEIALACDLLVAARDSVFGLPEVQRGVVAAAGGLFRLPHRIPRNVAMEMALTGDPFSAMQLQHFGLVNRLCEPGQALPQAVELAERVASRAPLSVRASVSVVRAAAGCRDVDAWAMQEPAFDTVRRSADHLEALAAFSEGRQPVWQGR